MSQWPEHPLVPDEWTDESGFHGPVVAAIAEGFCPKHLTPLSPADAFCSSCGDGWELTSSAGTVSTSGAWARWAVTDGEIVLVSRHI